MIISQGSLKTLYNNNTTQITYFQSDAINPPDKLIVNSKEYIIKPGLSVILEKGDKYQVISTDAHSYRVFTRKKIITNTFIFKWINLISKFRGVSHKPLSPMRIERSLMREHDDCNQENCKRAIKYTKISYFESRANIIKKGGWLILSPNNVEGLTNLKFLLSGLTTTIYISVISIIISAILGFIVAIPSLAKNKFFTYINIGYVEIIRAIPLLVLILWIHYSLPIMTGLNSSPLLSGIIALAISESAFQAEIFRVGINSIKKSQWEAGSSLRLTFYKRLRLVIHPQVIKNILPALSNRFVYVLKMSSLVSVIGIGDLTRKASELTVVTYRPFEIYTFLIIEYLILILIVSFFVRKLDKKLEQDGNN